MPDHDLAQLVAEYKAAVEQAPERPVPARPAWMTPDLHPGVVQEMERRAATIQRPPDPYAPTPTIPPPTGAPAGVSSAGTPTTLAGAIQQYRQQMPKPLPEWKETELDEVASYFTGAGKARAMALLRELPNHAVTPDQQAYLLGKIRNLARERGKTDRSFLSKVVERTATGVIGIAENMDRMFRQAGYDAETMRFLTNAEALRNLEDPVSSENWLARGVLDAAEMAPAMAGGLALSSAGAPVGIGFWITQIQPQRMAQYTAAGVNPEIAWGMGLASAAIEAPIEYLQAAGLVAVPKYLASGIRRVASKVIQKELTRKAVGVAGGVAGTYGLELVEEGIQGATGKAFENVSKYLDDNVADPTFKKTVLDSLKQGWGDMKDAAVPLAVLMMPGHMVSTIKSTVDIKRWQAMGERFKTGMLTTKSGPGLWTAMHPEEMAALAKIRKPSQQDFRDAGLGEFDWTVSERRRFATKNRRNQQRLRREAGAPFDWKAARGRRSATRRAERQATTPGRLAAERGREPVQAILDYWNQVNPRAAVQSLPAEDMLRTDRAIRREEQARGRAEGQVTDALQQPAEEAGGRAARPEAGAQARELAEAGEAQAQGETQVDLDVLTRPELVTIAQQAGVKHPAGKSKKQLISGIRAIQADVLRQAETALPEAQAIGLAPERVEAQPGAKTAPVTGVVAPSEAVGPAPAISATRQRLAKGGTRARAKLDKSITDLGKTIQGELFAGGPLNPKIMGQVVKVVESAIEAGAIKFADAVLVMAEKLPLETWKLAQYVEQAWGQARKDNQALDEPGSVADVLTKAGFTPPQSKLATPTEGLESREEIDRWHEERAAAGLPERMPRDKIIQAAKTRIAADYQGERTRLLEKASQPEGIFAPTDTAIFKIILEAETINAHLRGDADALHELSRLKDAWHRTGESWGRAGVMRWDPAKRRIIYSGERFHPGESETDIRMMNLLEALASTPPGLARKIAKAERKGDKAKAAVLRQKWGPEQIVAFRAKMLTLGWDMTKVGEIAQDERASLEFLRAIATAKAATSDKAFEYWQNAILSAPTTQAANIMGNWGHVAYYYALERPVATLVNALVGEKTGPQWEEGRELIKAFLPALSLAARNTVRSWIRQGPVLENMIGAPEVTRWEGRSLGAISGRHGELVRTMGYRGLQAMDELAKSFVTRLEVGAQALRIAKAMGLEGKPRAQAVAQMVRDADSPAWHAAYRIARTLAFQDPGGPIVQFILRGRRELPGLRYVVPFVTTPGNIFEEGLVHKNLPGSIKLFRELHRAQETGDWSRIPHRTAQQLIAWAGFLALMQFFDPDNSEDGLPIITGSIPAQTYDSRTESYRTMPAHSIRLWGTTWNYGRIEPFATILGLQADLYMTLKRAKAGEGAGQAGRDIWASMQGQVMNKTWLTGISDLAETLTSKEPGRWYKWVAGFGTSWIPNIIRHTARTTSSEYYPQRGVWGKGAEKPSRFLRRVFARTEVGPLAAKALGLPFEPEQPAFDIWGRKARRYSEASGPGSNLLFRLIVPVRTRKMDLAQGDQYMVSWNNRAKEQDEWHANAVRKSFTYRGKTRYLSDLEYAQYAELAGRYADALVRSQEKKGHLKNKYEPTAAEIELVKKAVTRGRELARNLLKPHWLRGTDASEAHAKAMRGLQAKNRSRP